MIVDLSVLQKGGTVHFRCGGEAVVHSVEEIFTEGHVSVKWRDNRSAADYSICGRKAIYAGSMGNYERVTCTEETPFDIIHITPAAFDWDTVKPGMAFKDNRDGETLWYVGVHPKNPRLIAVSSGENFNDKDLWCCDRDALTRAPEHDIGETK